MPGGDFSDVGPGGDIGPIGGIFDVGIGDLNFPTSSSLNIWVDWWLKEFLEDNTFFIEDRRDLPSVPLGIPPSSPGGAITGDELSDLGDTQIPGEPPTLPPEVDAIIMPTEISPGLYTMPGFGGTFTKAQILANFGISVTSEEPYRELHSIVEDDMSDHGSFFDNLGDVFVDFARTQFTDTNPPANLPVEVLSGTGGVLPPNGGGGGACAPGSGASPVYKKVCGAYKWVYPKRRRRRQLLTESDFNALLRIQNLKVNANMTMAISKAITR